MCLPVYCGVRRSWHVFCTGSTVGYRMMGAPSTNDVTVCYNNNELVMSNAPLLWLPQIDDSFKEILGAFNNDGFDSFHGMNEACLVFLFAALCLEST